MVIRWVFSFWSGYHFIYYQEEFERLRTNAEAIVDENEQLQRDLQESTTKGPVDIHEWLVYLINRDGVPITSDIFRCSETWIAQNCFVGTNLFHEITYAFKE